MKRLLSFLALTILVGSVFSAAIWFPSPPPEPPRHEPGNAANQKETKDGKPRETLWQRTTDDPVALFTFWIMAFTGVLAVSTIGLWSSTKRLTKFAAKQAEDMAASIRATEISAAATERSAAIAEKALVILERPYLFVVGVIPIQSDVAGAEGAGWDLFTSYSIVNHGRITAIIDTVDHEMFLTEDALPRRIPKNPFITFGPISQIIHAGEKHDGIKVFAPDGVEIVERRVWFHSKCTLFLRTRISYRSAFGSGYESSFFWEYCHGHSRFVPYGDETYNYAH